MKTWKRKVFFQAILFLSNWRQFKLAKPLSMTWFQWSLNIFIRFLDIRIFQSEENLFICNLSYFHMNILLQIFCQSGFVAAVWLLLGSNRSWSNPFLMYPIVLMKILYQTWILRTHV